MLSHIIISFSIVWDNVDSVDSNCERQELTSEKEEDTVQRGDEDTRKEGHNCKAEKLDAEVEGDVYQNQSLDIPNHSISTPNIHDEVNESNHSTSISHDLNSSEENDYDDDYNTNSSDFEKASSSTSTSVSPKNINECDNNKNREDDVLFRDGNLVTPSSNNDNDGENENSSSCNYSQDFDTKTVTTTNSQDYDDDDDDDCTNDSDHDSMILPKSKVNNDISYKEYENDSEDDKITSQSSLSSKNVAKLEANDLSMDGRSFSEKEDRTNKADTPDSNDKDGRSYSPNFRTASPDRPYGDENDGETEELRVNQHGVLFSAESFFHSP